MASPINSAMDSARVEIHGQTKRGQIPYEKPWVSYEKPWVSTKNHGFPMKNNGFLWKTIGFLWKTMGFLGMLKILGGMGVIELWWKSHWVGWNWALFSEKMMINQWMEWGVIEWGSSFSHRTQISKSGEVYVQHNGQYIGFWGDAMCIYIYIYTCIYIIIYMYQCVYIYICCAKLTLWTSKEQQEVCPGTTTGNMFGTDSEWGVEWHIPITKQGDENILFEYK